MAGRIDDFAPPRSLPGAREGELQSWVDLVQVNMGSSELDTEEVNFGVTPDEEAVAEISPPLKTGSKNKKRLKNFNEKEDILLSSAWLEAWTLSILLIKLVIPIGSEFMSTITSTRHLTRIVTRILSHTDGVSFKQVLANFVHGVHKFFIQNKVVSLNKTGCNKHVSCTRIRTG